MDALGGLRWTEVSIDNGDSAKNALDRITFPQEVLDKIAPTAVPLSSIIISDEPLSSETNYRTEFVAVLSNQPQGGFITRMTSPSTEHRARRRRLWLRLVRLSPAMRSRSTDNPAAVQSYYYQRRFW